MIDATSGPGAVNGQAAPADIGEQRVDGLRPVDKERAAHRARVTGGQPSGTKPSMYRPELSRRRGGAGSPTGRSTGIGRRKRRTHAAALLLIGDKVLSALGWRRHTTNAFDRWRLRPLVAAHAVEDLVERVLGSSPLPRGDNDVTLLIVGLRRQFPHLERLVGDADPDLIRLSRQIRKERLPEGRMPLVILAIRLAEIAQALIDAAPTGEVPPRTAAPDPLLSERHAVGAFQSPAARELGGAKAVIPPALARMPAPRSARAGASHRGPSSTAELVSAAAGSLGDCGPPA
ncbi:hypothetical protein ACFWP7_16935 [Streptomyces sp. NPDC058470]|uniref:hypothetical protein n=1 Tax=Streptomyces sp. NPDC058470 TaxID=3346515 RepID=UPI0036590E70